MEIEHTYLNKYINLKLSPYDILKIICDSYPNYIYNLDISVFNSWKTIALCELTEEDHIIHFLIPNNYPNKKFLNKLDNYILTIEESIQNTATAAKKLLHISHTNKRYYLIDFIMEMFNKLEFNIISFEKYSINKTFNIEEFYNFFSILVPPNFDKFLKDYNNTTSDTQNIQACIAASTSALEE